MRRILADKIPARLKSDAELDALLNALFDEVEEGYCFSLRKAIGKTGLNVSSETRVLISHQLFPQWKHAGPHDFAFFIVDYILMDPAERDRLNINAIPRPFPQR